MSERTTLRELLEHWGVDPAETVLNLHTDGIPSKAGGPSVVATIDNELRGSAVLTITIPGAQIPRPTKEAR